MLICSVLLPVFAAPLQYLIRRCSSRLCDTAVSAVCLISLLFTVFIACAPPEYVLIRGPFITGLSFASGGIHSIFAVMCSGMFFFSSLADSAYFRGEEHNERYRASLLLTLGALLGVFLAGDLMTLYVCFEAMSLSSWIWVAHNETDKAQDAADTYLTMAVAGGFVMLCGLFLLNNRFSTLDIAELRRQAALTDDRSELLLPGLCLLTGFAVKAGMFPFHIWLPKAHPAAPAPASALLSGILTKSGIFGILFISVCLLQGNEILTYTLLIPGTFTMVLGALLAVFSVDLKRTLACSSLSQIGFILVGAAVLSMGGNTSLAAGGIIAHSLNHGLAKLVLFITAGVIYTHCRTLDLNELRGAGRNNPVLMICFLTGGLSLAGVPCFGGYISKTLLHEAIISQMQTENEVLGGFLTAVEQLFLFSGGLTAAYMAKLFINLFIRKPAGNMPSFRTDARSLAAVVPASAALLVMGLIPSLSYEKIAACAAVSLGTEAFHVSYFTPENLKGALISLLIGAAVYWLLIHGLLTDRETGNCVKATTVLDLDEDVYRPVLRGLSFAGAFAARLCYSVTDILTRCGEKLIYMGKADRLNLGEDHHFTHYSKQYVKPGPIRQTLQFELMLFSLGLVAILVFLLVQIK